MNNMPLSIFKPKFFFLWEYMLSVILLIGFDLFFCWNLKDAIKKTDFSIFIPLIICLVVTIYCIWEICSYPTMSYNLYEDRLVLKCGLSKSTIFYSEIENISQIPSLGFPPFGLGFDRRPLTFMTGLYYFLKYRWIRMYATSYKNVIVIEAKKKRYGITPEEKDRFLNELNKLIESKNRI